MKKINVTEFFNKKRNMGIFAIAILVGAAAIVSTVSSNKIPLHDGDVLVDSQNVEVIQEDNMSQLTCDEARANLELKRNELIAKYDNTIKNTTNETERNDALTQKNELLEIMQSELNCEELIKAKSLPESLVMISQNKVTVTTFTDELDEESATKICSIIMEELQVSADKIIIQNND